MRSTDTTAVGGTDATPRTIEDIERRAAEIESAEHDAFAVLAAVLRELAITLPEGSTVVYDFAKLAKYVDQMNTSRQCSPSPSVVLAVMNLVHAFEDRHSRDEGDES